MIEKVFFLGGRQAGCIGLLAVLASGRRVTGAVAYDDNVSRLADAFGIPRLESVKADRAVELLSSADLLVCVHGREIVPERLLALPRLGGINAHPCLFAYKGADPVNRLLRDGGAKASVGVHRMTGRVDEGEVLAEEFVDISGLGTATDVYNALYPYYGLTLIKALGVLETRAR